MLPCRVGILSLLDPSSRSEPAHSADLSASLQSLKNNGAAPGTIDQVTVELSKLMKDFNDAVPYLPSYDQRNLDSVSISISFADVSEPTNMVFCRRSS